MRFSHFFVCFAAHHGMDGFDQFIENRISETIVKEHPPHKLLDRTPTGYAHRVRLTGSVFRHWKTCNEHVSPTDCDPCRACMLCKRKIDNESPCFIQCIICKHFFHEECLSRAYKQEERPMSLLQCRRKQYNLRKGILDFEMYDRFRRSNRNICAWCSAQANFPQLALPLDTRYIEEDVPTNVRLNVFGDTLCSTPIFTALTTVPTLEAFQEGSKIYMGDNIWRIYKRGKTIPFYTLHDFMRSPIRSCSCYITLLVPDDLEEKLFDSYVLTYGWGVDWPWVMITIDQNIEEMPLDMIKYFVTDELRDHDLRIFESNVRKRVDRAKKQQEEEEEGERIVFINGWSLNLQVRPRATRDFIPVTKNYTCHHTPYIVPITHPLLWPSVIRKTKISNQLVDSLLKYFNLSETLTQGVLETHESFIERILASTERSPLNYIIRSPHLIFGLKDILCSLSKEKKIAFYPPLKKDSLTLIINNSSSYIPEPVCPPCKEAKDCRVVHIDHFKRTLRLINSGENSTPHHTRLSAFFYPLGSRVNSIFKRTPQSFVIMASSEGNDIIQANHVSPAVPKETAEREKRRQTQMHAQERTDFIFGRLKKFFSRNVEVYNSKKNPTKQNWPNSAKMPNFNDPEVAEAFLNFMFEFRTGFNHNVMGYKWDKRSPLHTLPLNKIEAKDKVENDIGFKAACNFLYLACHRKLDDRLMHPLNITKQPGYVDDGMQVDEEIVVKNPVADSTDAAEAKKPKRPREEEEEEVAEDRPPIKKSKEEPPVKKAESSEKKKEAPPPAKKAEPSEKKKEEPPAKKAESDSLTKKKKKDELRKKKLAELEKQREALQKQQEELAKKGDKGSSSGEEDEEEEEDEDGEIQDEAIYSDHHDSDDEKKTSNINVNDW